MGKRVACSATTADLFEKPLLERREEASAEEF